MPTYLIESYMPAPEVDNPSAVTADSGLWSARHRWSLLLPEEQLCFHVVDGGSVEAVRELAVRAGFRCDRISPAVVLLGSWEPDR